MLVPVEASGRLWIAFTTVPGLYVGSGHPNSGAMLAWQGLHHWAISPDLLQYLLSQTYQKIKPSIQSFIVSFEFSMLKSMEVLWERSSSAGEREASHIDPFFPHPIVDLTFLVSKTPPEVSVQCGPGVTVLVWLLAHAVPDGLDGNRNVWSRVCKQHWGEQQVTPLTLWHTVSPMRWKRLGTLENLKAIWSEHVCVWDGGEDLERT